MNFDRSNKKLKDNIAFSSIYQMLAMIVPILTTPYVTRIFSIGQMGEYSLSLTTASLFVIVAQFGIETYGSREIAKSKSDLKKNEIFFELVSIQFIVSVFMFLIYNFIFIFIFEVSNWVLYFTQSLLILVNIFDIAWLYVGLEEIKRTIFRNTLTKVFVTISIFVFIKDETQLSLYALFNVLGMLIGNLTMVFSSRHYIDYKLKKYSFSKLHFKSSFKLLVPRLLESSNSTVEQSILKIATLSSQVGLYNEAKKINNLLFSVINSAINALSPRMSYYVSKNRTQDFKDIIEKGLIYSSIFSIIIISGIFAVSNDFVDFFFGEGFNEVAPLLNIISISLIIIPLMALINRGILIPHGMDKEYTNSVIITLVTGIIFNILLDPKYGAIGASISYLLSQVISFLYVLHISKNVINPLSVLKHLLVTIVSILINSLSVNYLKKNFIIGNSFLSFLFYGFLSVAISVSIIFIVVLLKRKRKDTVVNF